MKDASKGALTSMASPIMPPAIIRYQPCKPRRLSHFLTEVSNSLSEHNCTLKFAKHGRSPDWLDDLAGNDVNHQTTKS